MTVRILTGDCREVLKTLPDNSVHMCCTSPPYWNLRSYLPDDHADKHLEIGSEPTLQAWVDTMVEVFREVRRVLRDDGTLWLNLGDAYAGSRCGGAVGNNSTLNGKQTDHSRVAKRSHQAFTDDHKSQSQNAKRLMTPSARRDNHPVPRSDVQVAGLKPKDLMGQPWRVAFALQADGWWLRQEIIWAKPNPMPESTRDRCTKSHEHIFLFAKSGRTTIWRSKDTREWKNKVTKAERNERVAAPLPDDVDRTVARWEGHDYFYDFAAMQEAVSGGSHGRASGNKSHKGQTAYEAGDGKHRTKVGIVAYSERQKAKLKKPDGWDTSTGDGDHGSFHRDGRGNGSYAEGKSQRLGRENGWRSKGQNPKATDAPEGARQNDSFYESTLGLVDTRNPRSVWEGWEDEFEQFLAWKAAQVAYPDVWRIPTHPFKGSHFATFPPELAARCITAGCPHGGTILDPFGGSGTVGMVADRQHKHAILIELDERSVAMADERITGDSSLFAEVHVE